MRKIPKCNRPSGNHQWDWHTKHGYYLYEHDNWKQCKRCGLKVVKDGCHIKIPLTKPDTKIEWEKEFNERFVFRSLIQNVCKEELWDWDKDNPLIDARKVKSFIKSLLASQQDSFRRKVEEEVKKIDFIIPTMNMKPWDEKLIKLSDVLAKLETLKI